MAVEHLHGNNGTVNEGAPAPVPLTLSDVHTPEDAAIFVRQHRNEMWAEIEGKTERKDTNLSRPLTKAQANAIVRSQLIDTLFRLSPDLHPGVSPDEAQRRLTVEELVLTALDSAVGEHPEEFGQPEELYHLTVKQQLFEGRIRERIKLRDLHAEGLIQFPGHTVAESAPMEPGESVTF